jgi:hypothetical protein
LKRDGVDRSNFPKIDAHYGRMNDRLAVRNIVHFHEI